MHKKLLPLLIVILLALPGMHASADAGDPPYYREEVTTLPDGRQLRRSIINGPADSPAGFVRATAPREEALPQNSKMLSVPAYAWSFGCSATSAAMIAAYYDRNGYPNMYAGPTDGGVMPMDSSVWGHWTDSNHYTQAQCPVIASREGLDGRSTRGSIDDYWVTYNSSANDPYITGAWTQHTWGDAVGDYMKTSQSVYGNPDGATAFYYTGNASPLPCTNLPNDDGTYGRKLFYQARGYTVTDCYNQDTDNYGGGFTFAKYKAEIDAGRPVLLNLAGHSIVGVGYDDSTGTVYLHDTWDFGNHSMPWGGSYAGMTLLSVSIVNLQASCTAPSTVANVAISRINATQVKLTWSAAVGADHYEVWSSLNAPYFSPGANCQNPAPYACYQVSGTSHTLSDLGSTTNNHTYVVRSASACGATSVTPSNRVAEVEFGLVRGQ